MMRKTDPDHLSVSDGTAAAGNSKSTRKDGRRPLLVYLDPVLIRDLKKEALDKDINVYELVEARLKSRTTHP